LKKIRFWNRNEKKSNRCEKKNQIVAEMKKNQIVSEMKKNQIVSEILEKF
jgi:hypothetical protein